MGLLPASIAIGNGHDGRMESSLESIATGNGYNGRMELSLESLTTGHDDNGREHAPITAKRNITRARADGRIVENCMEHRATNPRRPLNSARRSARR